MILLIIYLISAILFFLEFFMYNSLREYKYSSTGWNKNYYTTDTRFKLSNGLWVLFTICFIIPFFNLFINLVVFFRWFYLSYFSDYWHLPDDAAFNKFIEWFSKTSY